MDGSYVELSSFARRKSDLTSSRTSESAGTPRLPVFLIMAVLLMGGLAIDSFVLRLHPTTEMLMHPNVWLLLGAFAVTEAVVLHVELGKNAHSVSMSELTLTVALFFLPLAILAPVRLVGGCIVLFIVRRQRPLKLMFNACVWVCDVAIATVVFQSLHGSLDNGPAHLVVPALAAALAAATVDSLAVNAVIAATSHEVRFRRTLGFLRTCLIEGLACSTLALVCVGAVAWSPGLIAPVFISTALVMVGFNLYNRLRKQHTNVNVLYDFIHELNRDPHGLAVVRALLVRVADLLRAEDVVLYMVTPKEDQLTTTRLDSDDAPMTWAVHRSEVPALVLDALDSARPVIVRETDRNVAHRLFLTKYGARDALIAPLKGEQELRGVLVVSDRQGDVSTFSADDGLLLQTLASHAGAALSNARLVDRLNHESLHDSLTGLANRAYFHQRLEQVLEHGPVRSAVLLMDLDRFKEVNDTLGHHHGDLLIKEVARRLATQVRGGDLLARLGGDEFAVLMTGVEQDDVVATAERVRGALAQPMMLQGVSMEITASIGVVLAPDHGTDAPTLMQRADVAMYTAKHQYTGVQVYEAAHDEYSPRRLTLAGNLRSAIEDRQLSLRYQPQARIKDGVILGAEALVRWEHPTYGEVPPDDFIAIAEQTGQIRELTRVVLDDALQACASWAAAGTPMSVSVNISVRNLLELDLADTVAELLERHGVPGSHLTLEITESHIMADPARTTQVLHALARLGIRISIDDFGTGYSSLAYLKELPVTEVKVDKSFVRDLSEGNDDAAIIRAIVQLARALRLEVIAEGVEDENAQRLLQELGCDGLQGYHLARPMKPLDFATWIKGRPTASRRAPLRALPTPRPAGDNSTATNSTQTLSSR